MKQAKLKKALSMMLVMVMLFSTLPFADSASAAETDVLVTGSCGPNATYSFNELTGELTISGTGEIDDRAFEWGGGLNAEIETVVIEDDITVIGAYAFSETSLKTITIPDSVIEIGEWAFSDTSLKTITIPDGIIKISNGTFYETSLESIAIPDSVTEIGNYAFANISSLESVTIPDSVTEIGERAFANTSLKTITIPDGIIKISDGTFSDTSLESITIPDSVIEIGNHAFANISSLESVDIPEGVTEIGAYAFANTSLKSITIPDGVTKISEGTFYDTLLESITIPDSVTEIGEWAFSNTSLESIIIPAEVTEIGAYAFYETSLKTITISDGVTEIGEYAFSNTSLESIIIPAGVTKINNGTFANTSLKTITIPDGVTKIGEWAFSTTSLESINISNSVTEIGAYAFAGTSLKSVAIPNGVTEIIYGLFRNCSSLSSVSIPNSVTAIGEDAFMGTGLTEVEIPASVTKIEGGAFYSEDENSVDLLETIVFLGNAPSVISSDGMLLEDGDTVLPSFNASKATLYFNSKNAEGWTTPTWNGYNTIDTADTAEIDTDTPAVNADKAALTWNTIKNKNTSQTKVISDLKLPKTGKSGSKITWASSDTKTISNTGKVTRPADKAKKVTLTATISKGKVKATVKFNLTVTAKESKPSTSFSDVKTGAWYSKNVKYVVENGLMNGTSKNAFSPDVNLTRAMLVTILYRQAGSPNVSKLANPFSDVKDGQFYTKAVKWAAANKIVQGSNGKFSPNDNITRQDFAVILNRYAKLVSIKLPAKKGYKGFADKSNISSYAKNSVEALYKSGVVNGKTGNRFDPRGNTTRAESAAMLHRFLKIK